MTISAFLAPDAKFKAFDNNGNPLVGGQLFTYAAGTLTPIATWTDWTASTPNSNPVVLNSRGETSVYLLPNIAYKFTLTDAAGNNIWSVDQILNSQLITLFGGVDTGVANAYVLMFPAAFSSLTNGIVIYWVPANANTGPSTVNVNALGVVNLTNPDGSALSANQILAAQPIQMMYYNGAWILLNGTFVSGTLRVGGATQLGSASINGVTSYGVTAAAQVDISGDKGTFTGTLTGMTSATTGTINFIKNGNFICLYATSNITGTSNAASMGMTGVPAELQPLNGIYVLCEQIEDSGTTYTGAISTSGGSGTLVFYKQLVSGSNLVLTSAFTSSGTKGIQGGWSCMYPIA